MKHKKYYIIMGLIVTLMVVAVAGYSQIRLNSIYQTEVLPYEQKHLTHINNEEYDEAQKVLMQVVANEDLFKTVPNVKRGN